MTADDGAEPVVTPTADGATVTVGGVVRARFVGDLADPDDRAALDELLRELFPDRSGK